MAHSHSHDLGASDRRILGTVALNVLLTVGQVVGGVLSGSVALVADALHNLNDAVALVIVLVARRVARRRPDRWRTFGYRRAEVVGALINLVALATLGLFLAYESVLRFFEPREVEAWVVVALAGLALAVDVLTVVLLYAMRRGSLNVRAAFLHNLTDALASLAVLLGGVAMLLWDVTWVDPLLSLVIVAYIFYGVFKMLPGTLNVLMEGAPEGFDLEGMARLLCEVEGVRDVHHVHVWQLDEHRTALEAHVVIRRSDAGEMDRIRGEVRGRLRERFGVSHATLELEFASTAGSPEHDTSVVPMCGAHPH